MHSLSINLYEQAFESRLREQKIAFESVVQTQRVESGGESVKNFDFVLQPASDRPILVELKGRTFHGRSLAGLKGLDAWVTFEDVEALSYWLDAARQKTPGASAVIVFVYRLEQIDVESDGWPLYDFGGERFLMLFIELEHYRKAMKCRSPKWQTVNVTAGDFRNYAKPIDFIFATENLRKIRDTK